MPLFGSLFTAKGGIFWRENKMLNAPEKYRRTREQLLEIPVPEMPKWNSSHKVWEAVQHGELAASIVNAADTLGLRITRECWAINPIGTDMFGCVDFDVPRNMRIDVPPGIKLALGVRHSNAGKWAITFGIGATVSVCTNGVFYSEFTVKHRHTKELDLDDFAQKAFNIYLQESRGLLKMCRTLRVNEIEDREAAYLLVQAGGRVIPWRFIPDVWNAWKNPKYDEFQARTLWSLYNAFTEITKTLSPVMQFRVLQNLKSLVQSE